MTSEKKIVLSGIQPTGHMHFGNYFGAVENWVRLQDTYNCHYCVVNYHAMTIPYKAAKLRQATWDIIFNLLACGIRAENLFIQSLVPEHAELAWVFNCMCSYGALSRMTQFKNKTSQVKEQSKEAFISVGLFDYPVLQAADILIYRAHYVPVGKDQEQHLELTRNIADRFNYQFGKEYFVLPEPLYTQTPKILSTADPSRKMSKSAGEKHYINLFAEDARIRKQIRSAVTDAGNMPIDDATGKRTISDGLHNLFELLKACGKQDSYDALMESYQKGTLSYGTLKDEVAEAMIVLSTDFRAKKDALKADKKQVKYQIQESSARIRQRAKQTLAEVRELTGLIRIKE